MKLNTTTSQRKETASSSKDLNLKESLLNKRENLLKESNLVLNQIQGKDYKKDSLRNKKAKSMCQSYISSFNSISNTERALLPTALVKLEIDGVKFGPVRALLDTGSMINLMSHQFQHRNQMPYVQTARRMFGIDGIANIVNKKVMGKICSCHESAVQINTELYVLPENGNWHPMLPSEDIQPKSELLSHTLADPLYWQSRETDILLGIVFFSKILISVISRTYDDIVMVETTLGIVTCGAECDKVDEDTGAIVSPVECLDNNDMNRLLTRMWRLDEIGNASKRTEEEEKVERNFIKTYSRDSTGRFVVTIPIKEGFESAQNFGSSRDIALRRFKFMERKLEKNPEMRVKYIDFMREYESLGHMRLATEKPRPGELVYYIPHHYITKKWRIVFDASCKTDKGISFNEIQMLGEKLQRDLHEIIMRFRRHSVAFCADIKKMFRQVRVDKRQWNTQRIFWREDRTQLIKEYQLCVVTQGMTSSGHNSVRSLIQCARDARERYPEAASIIESDFYMDDGCSGGKGKNHAITLAKDIEKVLLGAGFELSKWKSNCKELLQAMRSEEEGSMLFFEDEKTSILGLKWLTNEDKFTFVVKTPTIEETITKRKISSCVLQLYDPNGFISPVITRGKILIQDMWRLGLEWDEQVPKEIEKKWNEFWKDISALEEFKIDRWIGTKDDFRIELHGFSDASTAAYGAVVYVRAEHADGRITTQLLISRTRVAPIKTISIPRLELSAAEMLSRLLIEINKAMEWKDPKYTLWTDSLVVLHWIRKLPCDLKTFVANRVSGIQTNTEVKNWRHIGTKDNPADLLSRGTNSTELVGNQLWLHGPNWLAQASGMWPKNLFEQAITPEMESEIKVFVTIVPPKPLQIFIPRSKELVDVLDYTSGLERAMNIIAYIMRFVNKLKERVANGNKAAPIVRKQRRKTRGQNATTDALTNDERTAAVNYIIRTEQERFYGKEITMLKKGKAISDSSSILSLVPKWKDGILRAHGRLSQAEADYEFRHPAIIPEQSRLAWLIMHEAHEKTKHGSVQLMMQYIRQRYWIIKLRSTVRNFIHKCVTCVRFNHRFENQLMADLPGDRVQLGKPFLCTGVDYAGPLEMKILESNQSTKKKYWIVIFVCLKTRAVHIDHVISLTTIDFIACYERFIGKRGRCERMYSDNGTTFVGAAKEIRKSVKIWNEKEGKEIADQLSTRGTEWKFMTPAAPHQGGIYEAAVKSMKYHFIRVVGQKVLTHNQLTTLLAQIEAILNSRPLYPLTDDPNDVQALTPGHFLIGEPLVLPLPFAIDDQSQAKGVKLWRERQIMLGHIWKRWKEEYLSTLQERKKWRKEKDSLKIGQLVLLKSENFPPAQWGTGRITELIPSRDGLVRSVVVRTATNNLKRPVQKICILPVDTSDG